MQRWWRFVETVVDQVEGMASEATTRTGAGCDSGYTGG